MCAAVFVLCEAWLYDKGHETFLREHKTEAGKANAEKKLRGDGSGH